MSDIEIKKFMAEQLNNGVSLSEIQKLIVEKFKRKMTFLEVRVMASELENIEWTKQDPVKPEPAKEEPTADEDTAGKTVVEVSKLVRPGAAASGSVKFASGASAEWILDQTGRLGLENAQGKPTPEDLKEFQQELQAIFSRGR